MITASILKLLEDNSFGTIDRTGTVVNNGLYLEKLTQDKKSGVAIFSRGFPLQRGSRKAITCDLYSRGINDIDGSERLRLIRNFFIDNYSQTCDLDAVTGYTTQTYKNVTIIPSGNIENVGLDANDRVIYALSIEVIYNED